MGFEFVPQVFIISIPTDVANENRSAYVNRMVMRTLNSVPNLHHRSPARLEYLGDDRFALHVLVSSGDSNDPQALRATPKVDNSGSDGSSPVKDASPKGNAQRPRTLK